MSNEEARLFIENQESLPTLPTIASRVANLTSETDASVKEIAELIEKDMALSAKILQIINSSFYSFSREIDSISEAVSLMGFKQVGNLALGLSVIESFPQNKIYGFSYRNFWERSVSNAVAAVITATHLKSNAPNALFTTALLQNIGTYILVRHLPIGYGQAIGVSGERNSHVIHAEQEVLGINHAEVGALLAEKWRLPRAMQIAIRHHHFSEFESLPKAALGQDETSSTVKLTNISNLITDALYEEDKEERIAALKNRARKFFNLESEQVDEILKALPREIDGVKSLLQLAKEQDDADGFSSGDMYYESCPKCNSNLSLKFCADCGAPLLRTTAKAGKIREKEDAGKILIAEDSQAIRTALVSLLRKRGYKTFIAVNGEDAVGIARKEQPDLILMDIQMPVLDGIQALRLIRSDIRLQSTPIVMLTSITDLDTVTMAIESGANDYVAKPFKVEKLLERVEKYVHGRNYVAEPDE